MKMNKSQKLYQNTLTKLLNNWVKVHKALHYYATSPEEMIIPPSTKSSKLFLYSIKSRRKNSKLIINFKQMLATDINSKRVTLSQLKAFSTRKIKHTHLKFTITSLA